jgi:transcriptional regulator with XRE-family HTH domain
MTGLGQALRWLREKQARKQYRVADTAGITKGMLSAYETGRQRPSLETLEKILETLGCDLNDLHNALQIVNGRPERIKGWRGWQTLGWLDTGSARGAAFSGRAAGTGAYGAYGTVESIAEGAPPSYGAPPDSAFRGTHTGAPPSDTTAPPYDESGEMGESGIGSTDSVPPALRRAAQGVTGPGYAGVGAFGGAASAARSADLDAILGRDRPRLAQEEEMALGQMMDGFHSLVRFWHRSLTGMARRPAPGSSRSEIDRPADPAPGPRKPTGAKDAKPPDPADSD